MKVIKILLSISIVGFLGLVSIFILSKNDKIIQKNVEINIDVKNIINTCKTQEDDELSILF
ncbi:MAG: hypothetical protein EBT63_05320 [Proteobacteria bacterium]|nr:hypothetical protein [Pseudomonadota bacterium]NCA28255.1 hypothetical protein [Pseudomonadota bacterium]